MFRSPRSCPTDAAPAVLTPDRRQALAVMAGGALAGFAPAVMAQGFDVARHRPMLDAFVDVLLPADDLGPAASTLGVGGAILDFAQSQPLLQRLIAMVGDWLDAPADGPFVRMSPERQQALVDYMASADPDLLEGRFYRLIRLFSLEFYYSSPEALTGLDLSPSPQPQGYPPPWG